MFSLSYLPYLVPHWVTTQATPRVEPRLAGAGGCKLTVQLISGESRVARSWLWVTSVVGGWAAGGGSGLQVRAVGWLGGGQVGFGLRRFVLPRVRVVASSPFVLWLQPGKFGQRVQVLVTSTFEGPTGRSYTSHQPLFLTGSTLVAAAMGYSRRYRRLLFIQQCVFRHVRRYLLLIDATRLAVELRGIMPRLGAYWRALTQPTQEIFANPLSGQLLWDVGLPRSLLLGVGTPRANLRRALLDVTPLVDTDTPSQVEVFLHQHWRGVQAAVEAGQGWQRYILTWGVVVVAATALHGFLRRKRARSIKRRRVKRLVRRTQYRFWPR